MKDKDFVEQVAAHPEKVHIFAAAVSDQKDPKESHVRYCDIRVRPCASRQHLCTSCLIYCLATHRPRDSIRHVLVAVGLLRHHGQTLVLSSAQLLNRCLSLMESGRHECAAL